MKSISRLHILFLSLSFTIGCSKVGFQTQSLAAQSSVLGSNGTSSTLPGADGTGGSNTGGNSGDNSGGNSGGNTAGNTGNTAGSDPGDGGNSSQGGSDSGSNSMDIKRECSDSSTSSNGNVQLAPHIFMRVTNSSGSTVCTNVKTDYRSDLLNDANFVVDPGCSLPDGQYHAKLYDSDFPNTSSGLGNFSFHIVRGQTQVDSSSLTVTYASNPRSTRSSNDPNENYDKCETYASPLAIQLKKTPLRLSSPDKGILFNILGDNGGNVPRLISWPLNDSAGFLVLPKNGRVDGINQMFGNNTRGPDGSFASNGYEALAKYDLNKDGKIDAADPIFSDLRVWVDANRDGKSQSEEIKTLDDLGIRTISLQYDGSFAEKDRFGNEILYKSIAERKDQPLLIFDIWFRLTK